MTRSAKGLATCVGVVAVLYSLTWLFGRSAADRALLDLDRAQIAAAAAHLSGATWREGLSDGPLPQWLNPESVVARYRVALPSLLYSEHSCSRNSRLARTSEPSFLLWYGPAAVVVWENDEWFPARSSRLRRLAETGY